MENNIWMKRFSWALSFLIIFVTIISIRNNRQENPNFLDNQLLEIEQYFSQRDIKNISVSQANVAWHLDHTLKTINNVCMALQDSNPEEYNSTFNFRRILVHTLGNIPRGIAQSPPSVQPPEIILLDSLISQLNEAREHVHQISNLEEHTYFAHPVFDHLDRDQSRRFLEVHTNHHLKIIKDILEE